MLKSKKIYQIISWLIILTIFWFLFQRLFSDWSGLQAYDFSVNYFYLFISFIFFLLNLFFSSFIWALILKLIDQKINISFSKVFTANLYSRFGRYIPGKIWCLAGRVYYTRGENISKKIVFTSSLQHMVIGIISGLLLGFLLIGKMVSFLNYHLLILATIVLLVLLFFPKSYYFIVNYLLKRIKKEKISSEHFLQTKRLFLIFFLVTLNNIINGTAFFYSIYAVFPISFDYFFAVIGAFSLAGTLGIVALFAPAGIGVREGILVTLLSGIYPAAAAIVLALFSRIWFTFSELIIFFLVFIFDKYKKNVRTK